MAQPLAFSSRFASHTHTHSLVACLACAQQAGVASACVHPLVRPWCVDVGVGWPCTLFFVMLARVLWAMQELKLAKVIDPNYSNPFSEENIKRQKVGLLGHA